MVRFLGEPLIVGSGTGSQKWTTRIVTVFPTHKMIVTLPGIHASQREAGTEEINRQRLAEGRNPLSRQERLQIAADSVDLLIEGDDILIRPDPERMDLAFAADELLHEIIHRKRIRFLFAQDQRVREAIIRRGEAWRIRSLPRSTEEMQQLIRNSRVAVKGQPIYYYCAVHGTRILTLQEFVGLGKMSVENLRLHLAEIASLANSRNKRHQPELALFVVNGDYRVADLVTSDVDQLDEESLRRLHAAACRRLTAATPQQFQHDEHQNGAWRNQMFRRLIAQNDETLSDQDLLGLSDEYFMQIQWLPGARVVDGGLIFEARSGGPADLDSTTDSDPTAHELICNLTREYDGIEFINIGRIVRSLSRRVPTGGRRDVYVAHFRARNATRDELHIIRFQKWGVRERLDDNKPMLQAMLESEEYTDYILDRRLACRQLGMNLVARLSARKVQERYQGKQTRLHGSRIWSPYIERDYVSGIATDKVPQVRLRDPHFAQQLATALGRAAAINLIVGRANPIGEVVFDDGDELLIENDLGGVHKIVVADPTGAFANFQADLSCDAPFYAAPVRQRLAFVSGGNEFTRAYLDAFVSQFEFTQARYRQHRDQFAQLFCHRQRDPAGNLAHRWAKVLERLDRSKAITLAELIRQNIHG